MFKSMLKYYFIIMTMFCQVQSTAQTYIPQNFYFDHGNNIPVKNYSDIRFPYDNPR